MQIVTLIGTGDAPPDKAHPTAIGAQALYAQVLRDFPEIMQRFNV